MKLRETLKKLFGGTNSMTMTAVKSNNYPQDVIDAMVSSYEESPNRETVNALAAQFGKTERSVIAKLSALGVYVAQPKPTKRPPQVRKADLVADIEAKLGVEFVSLNKAGFGDFRSCSKQYLNRPRVGRPLANQSTPLVSERSSSGSQT